MALYFYFNETTGDLVYSDQATYDAGGYTSIGEQTNMNPESTSDWVFDSKRSTIKTVSKDPAVVGKIAGLTNMYHMFDDCGNLTSLDLSGLDTSTVTSMRRMFYDCSSLTSLDLSGFDTSAVTNMSEMFSGCSSLAGLDLSGFDTSAVTSMSYMFKVCHGLTSLDLSGFDTSAVTVMAGMFGACINLTSLDLSGFDTSAVTSMTNMFGASNSLRLITISGKMSNVLSQLPVDQYYPVAGGFPVAKASLTAGTWVRDEADLSMVTSIVQQAQMSQAVSRRIGKLGRDLRSVIDAVKPSVDIVKTMEHSTSYTRDTLEIVVDTTGKVTSIYFIDATTKHQGGQPGNQ